MLFVIYLILLRSNREMLTNNAYESSEYNNIQKQISIGIYNTITHQMKNL